MSFDLADVLDEPGVGDYVTCRLVIQEVPGIGNATVGLREYCALVSHRDCAICIVLDAFGWAITVDSVFGKKDPVLSFVVSGFIDSISMYAMDQLTDSLVWLLRLSMSGDLVLS